VSYENAQHIPLRVEVSDLCKTEVADLIHRFGSPMILQAMADTFEQDFIEITENAHRNMYPASTPRAFALQQSLFSAVARLLALGVGA